MLIHPVLGRADIPPSEAHTAPPKLMALKQLKAGEGWKRGQVLSSARLTLIRAHSSVFDTSPHIANLMNIGYRIQDVISASTNY